jgi:hypothetical protein
MSRIRANTITNQNANGAPNFPDGITVSGVVTATTTSQNITGDLTVTGNIGVGGTLTYEDVTNIDSVGVVTARAGVNVVGNDLNVGSNIKLGNASGIVTATSFSGSGANLTGIAADKIFEGNTQVETVDTGSDGSIRITTEGSERWRVNNIGIMTSYYSGNRGGMSLLGAFQAEVASNATEGIIPAVTTDNIHCFDSCGWYNNSNHRFTPQVKGHYQFHLSGQFGTDMNGSSIEQSFAFKLNGTAVSQYADGYSTNYGNYYFTQLSQIVFCNGTSDYVQAWMSSNRNPNIFSTTKWSGYLIHPVE